MVSDFLSVVDWETAGTSMELLDLAGFFIAYPSPDPANRNMYGTLSGLFVCLCFLLCGFFVVFLVCLGLGGWRVFVVGFVLFFLVFF